MGTVVSVAFLRHINRVVGIGRFAKGRAVHCTNLIVLRWKGHKTQTVNRTKV
jgi:hypothetical protein